jgi:hypothetical protein
MRAWIGWTAALASAGMTAPTWEAWRACQQHTLRRQQQWHKRHQEGSPFSERELARLSFERWLYQRGHLDALGDARNNV